MSKFTSVLVTDSELTVFAVDGPKILHKEIINSKDENFAKTLQAALSKYRFPIKIFMDTMEQFFVEKTLPKVLEPWVRSRMQTLNLSREFSDKNVRGIISGKFREKSKQGKDKEPVMLCAIPIKDSLAKVLETIDEIKNDINGIYSLPVEISAVITKKGKSKKGKSTDAEKVWKIICIMSQSGGLRQAVVCNSDFKLTRFTQITNLTDQAVLNREVADSIKDTASYVRRIYGIEGTICVECVAGTVTASTLQELLKDEHVTLEENKLFAGSNLYKQEDSHTRFFLQTANRKSLSGLKFYNLGLLAEKKLSFKAVSIFVFTFLGCCLLINSVIDKIIQRHKFVTKHDQITNEIQIWNKQISTASKFKDLNQADEMLFLYRLYSNVVSGAMPMFLMGKLSSVSKSDFTISSVEWLCTTNCNTINKFQIKMEIAVKVENPTGYAEDLQKKLEKIKGDFDEVFLQYETSIEDIKEDQVFTKKVFNLDTKVVLTGPVSNI